MQTGWSEFCHFVANPLRDGHVPRRPGRPKIDPLSLPEKSRVFVTRRRYDWFFAIILLLSATGAFFVWRNFGNPSAFSLLPLIIFHWALLRFSTPKEGAWNIKWTGTKTHALVGIAFLTLPIMFVVMLACGFAGINPFFVMMAGTLFMAVICFIVMRDSFRREKAQRLEDAMQTVSSAEHWETMERNLQPGRSTPVT